MFPRVVLHRIVMQHLMGAAQMDRLSQEDISTKDAEKKTVAYQGMGVVRMEFRMPKVKTTEVVQPVVRRNTVAVQMVSL